MGIGERSIQRSNVRGPSTGGYCTLSFSVDGTAADISFPVPFDCRLEHFTFGMGPNSTAATVTVYSNGNSILGSTNIPTTGTQYYPIANFSLTGANDYKRNLTKGQILRVVFGTSGTPYGTCMFTFWVKGHVTPDTTNPGSTGDLRD